MAEHEYSLTDLSSASYLIAVGEQLVRLDFSNPKRVIFYFQNTPTVRRAVEEFWNGRARVDPLHLLQTQKLLKQRIYAHQQP